jgi:3-phenylpropionate/trans-cinnamate dioxygenase ferredoxin subunit
MSEQNFLPVANVSDIPPDSAKVVEAGGQSILICHSEGQFFAVANRCSHAEEPLACGRIKYGWIACPAHGARFDLETGEAMNPPATAPIRTFPVRISEGVIELEI